MESFFLFFHIIAAAIWIGASVAVLFLAPRLRAEGESAGVAFMRGFEGMGKILFNVAGIVVLVTGIILVTQTSWKFSDAFVSIGFLVVIAGAFMGMRVFNPLARRGAAAYEAGDAAEVNRVYGRIRAFGFLDVGLLSIAVLAMVYKWGA